MSLAGLVRVASLTNQELFTKVVAAIKRSLKNKKKNQKDWRGAAVRVATSAAKGERGYCCDDDWVRQFDALSGSGEGFNPNFGQALKALPVRECYRKRLINAFDAISPSMSSSTENLTIRQIAGLIRGSTFLTAGVDEGADDDSGNNDCELQARALSYLVTAMPQLSSNPCDLFLGVQLPILQKLNRGAFAPGGVKAATSDVGAEFRSLLDLDFGEQNKSSMHSGEKRKWIPEEGTASANKLFSSNVAHLLEAAHLARNGAVRAQHGAVIYVPSGNHDNGSEAQTKVIGRGWNHDFVLNRSVSNKNKIVLHSEVHAVVDAIRNHGEDECFEKLFPRATIMIVELHSDYAYETCHPCPKCNPLLRAVGITNVLHTTPLGKIKELDLGPANIELLDNDNVSIPLGAACAEQKIICKRLQAVSGICKKVP